MSWAPGTGRGFRGGVSGAGQAGALRLIWIRQYHRDLGADGEKVIWWEAGEHGLTPGEHAVDPGFMPGDELVAARRRGITLLGPLRASRSAQLRPGGYAITSFTLDWGR